MSHLIQIVGLANGQPSKAAGMWVQEYDPNGFDGMGELVLTDHRHNAKRYHSTAEAMGDYTRISETHPTRPGDGKPNRPMTAWTVEVVPE